MSCKEVCNYFSAYLDGEISESLKKEIEMHFNNCPHCRAILNKAYSIRQYMKRLSRIKTSDNFEVRLREKISQELTRKKSFINKWTESINYLPNKPIIAFTAAAVLVIIFIIMNVQRSDYKKFQIKNAPLQEEILNQKAGGTNVLSDKDENKFLKEEAVLSATPSGINDSTGKVFDLKEREQSLDSKVKYINKSDK
ncbi:MAG: zf-HC2 domain-containing protein [Candidatus Helarchaeota archaeon]|nr:zf-HC2 domain-containing protein [Candidatus Helarchaeota archaeon]